MAKAFAAIAVAYAAAAAAAVAFGIGIGWSDPIAVAAGADVVATFVIFGFSRIHDNSSFYDAYWSVAPIAIAFYWALVCVWLIWRPEFVGAYFPGPVFAIAAMCLFVGNFVSAMMLTAISSGLRPPRSSPTGACTCLSRSGEIPRFNNAS